MRGSEVGKTRHEGEAAAAAAAAESPGNICRKSAPVVKSNIAGELARLCSAERTEVSAAAGSERLESARIVRVQQRHGQRRVAVIFFLMQAQI